jgi:hypothetical protein
MDAHESGHIFIHVLNKYIYTLMPNIYQAVSLWSLKIVSSPSLSWPNSSSSCQHEYTWTSLTYLSLWPSLSLFFIHTYIYISHAFNSTHLAPLTCRETRPMIEVKECVFSGVSFWNTRLRSLKTCWVCMQWLWQQNTIKAAYIYIHIHTQSYICCCLFCLFLQHTTLKKLKTEMIQAGKEKST